MKTNKKQQETVSSTIDNLPKELRERIVIVGTESSNSGNIDNSNITRVNGNSASSDNSEPIRGFDELDKNVSIKINYDASGGLIKSQLKEQGFKFDKKSIKYCEIARIDILALFENDILTEKETKKAFKRLNTLISFNVIEKTFGKVNAKIQKTFINNKELK